MFFPKAGVWRAPIAGLMLCVLSAAQAAEPSVLLKPKYVPGRRSYVEAAMESSQKMTGGMFGERGQQATVRQIHGVWQKTESSSPTEGTRIVLTFDRVQMAMQSPGGSLSFDSDVDDPKGDSNMLASMLSPMLGMSMTLEVGTDGSIKSFRGMRDIVEKIEKSVGPHPLFARFKSNLTDESAKVIWGEQRLMLYPNKEVRVGDTWEHVTRHAGALTGDRIYEYKFRVDRIGEENGRPIALITYTGTIRVAQDPHAAPGMMGPVNFKSGSVEGTATFDVELGEYVRHTEQTHITMEIEGHMTTGEGSPKTKLEQHLTRTTTVMTEAQRRKQKNANRKTPDDKQQTPPT